MEYLFITFISNSYQDEVNTFKMIVPQFPSLKFFGSFLLMTVAWMIMELCLHGISNRDVEVIVQNCYVMCRVERSF